MKFIIVYGPQYTKLVCSEPMDLVSRGKKAGVISCVLPQTSGRALLLSRWQTPQRSLSLL